MLRVGLLGASALLHRIWRGKLAQGAFAFEFTAREAGSPRGVGLFAPKLFKEHDTREPFLVEFTAREMYTRPLSSRVWPFCAENSNENDKGNRFNLNLQQASAGSVRAGRGVYQ